MDALAKAQSELATRRPDLKLLIWDAFRPIAVQRQMWAQVPDTNYVADPENGGSSHNKGAAIDLTLSSDGLTSIDMGTPFDHFGKEAHHGYKKLSKQVKANRALLRSVMEAAGFQALETEWWHYKLPGEQPIQEIVLPCE
jgi:D-alanyl-D-alanine dipeptidase